MSPTSARNASRASIRRSAGVRTPRPQAFTPALAGAGPTVSVTGGVFYGKSLQVITAVGLLGVALFTYSIDGAVPVPGTTAANVNIPELPGVSLQFAAGTYAVNTLNGVV